MIWHDANEFFSMGGHGLYVWGSYGAMAVLLAVEAVAPHREEFVRVVPDHRAPVLRSTAVAAMPRASSARAHALVPSRSRTMARARTKITANA